MKTTFVSTTAVAQALRHHMMRHQSDLVKAQTEVSSGRHADIGLELGNRTGQTISFRRDIDRLEAISDGNALAKARLTSSQNSLSQVTNASQTFFSTLTANRSGDANKAVIEADARAAFASLRGAINTTLNGEYIFAGINTDAEPLANFEDKNSTARQAFDAAFVTQFGFPPGDPQAANITSAEIEAFLDGPVTDLFLGADWSGTMSSASDQPITSRITLGETTQTSVTANEKAIRKAAMASAIVIGLFNSGIDAGVQRTVADRASSLVGSAIGDIGVLQSEMGVVQQRITRADERTNLQVQLFKTSLMDLENVDPYEASTRVSALLTQIETSYALTARINQLSLLNYLP